jgi:hypothetical protein
LADYTLLEISAFPEAVLLHPKADPASNLVSFNGEVVADDGVTFPAKFYSWEIVIKHAFGKPTAGAGYCESVRVNELLSWSHTALCL